jgi:hypothetical protein
MATGPGVETVRPLGLQGSAPGFIQAYALRPHLLVSCPPSDPPHRRHAHLERGQRRGPLLARSWELPRCLHVRALLWLFRAQALPVNSRRGARPCFYSLAAFRLAQTRQVAAPDRAPAAPRALPSWTQCALSRCGKLMGGAAVLQLPLPSDQGGPAASLCKASLLIAASSQALRVLRDRPPTPPASS